MSLHVRVFHVRCPRPLTTSVSAVLAVVLASRHDRHRPCRCRGAHRRARLRTGVHRYRVRRAAAVAGLCLLRAVRGRAERLRHVPHPRHRHDPGAGTPARLRRGQTRRCRATPGTSTSSSDGPSTAAAPGGRCGSSRPGTGTPGATRRRSSTRVPGGSSSLTSYNSGAVTEAQIMRGRGHGRSRAAGSSCRRAGTTGVSFSAPRDITSAVKLPDWRWYATGPGHAVALARGPHAGRLVVAANHSAAPAGRFRRHRAGAQVLRRPRDLQRRRWADLAARVRGRLVRRCRQRERDHRGPTARRAAVLQLSGPERDECRQPARHATPATGA